MRIRSFKPGKFGPFACSTPEHDVLVGFHSLASGEVPCKVLPEHLDALKRFHRSIPGDGSSVTKCGLCFSGAFQKRLQETLPDADRVVLELRPDTAVVIDYPGRRLDFYFEERNQHYFTDARIDPVAFSHFLHDFDGLMIHSSSISFDGKAAVFLASDEGGKTTAANLCGEGVVLSDDQNLFRKQPDGNWLAWGTPWTTFKPFTGSAVPAAFFLIEKAEEFSLHSVSSNDLFSFLWDEHYPARFMLPKVYQTKLFDLFRDLSRSAPAYIMRFPRDHVDREAILKCLNP